MLRCDYIYLQPSPVAALAQIVTARVNRGSQRTYNDKSKFHDVVGLSEFLRGTQPPRRNQADPQKPVELLIYQNRCCNVEHLGLLLMFRNLIEYNDDEASLQRIIRNNLPRLSAHALIIRWHINRRHLNIPSHSPFCALVVLSGI